jgi:two-component sensor histidine kinase
VHALAVNHDLLVKSQWKSVDVGDLVNGQLAHFGDLVGRRILFEGQPLRLSASAAQTLGMALHELSTNAAKHGALSGEGGSIKITWQIVAVDASERFTITWVERGGLPVTPPAHRGFGTTVITKMAQMSLDGEAQLDFPSSGLRWQLSCPAGNAIEAQ